MSIEEAIFCRRKIDYQKLLKYGFVKEESTYKFSKQFMNDTFNAEIIIESNGKIIGKVYDTEFDDEYVNFRLEEATGEFVGKVKNEYENILKDIANNCSEEQYFMFEQSNRITKLIIKKYNDIPEFPWKKPPEGGIFRNQDTNKWYGLIMNISKNKIDEGNEKVEIINVKLNENTIIELLKKKGFYPAYHMNKKSWISIILDDTLSDDEIMKYIEESHKYTERK